MRLKHSLLLFLAIHLFIFSISQSLSPERVKRIKNATVRIIADGEAGTGFFINANGDIATCWHVIDSAYRHGKKIFIEFNDGDTAEVVIANKSLRLLENQLVYDHCILSLKRKSNRTITYLKLGEFNTTQEGAEIYTCGYPLGYPQQFISKGIISTKYSEDITYTIYGKTKSKPRQIALLDLTLNRGNSGGAIVKIGNLPNDDSVIGIADFIVNPLGKTADSIANSMQQGIGNITFNSSVDANGKVIRGNDPNKIAIIFSQAIGSLSIGVSGCISVNYLRETKLFEGK